MVSGGAVVWTISGRPLAEALLLRVPHRPERGRIPEGEGGDAALAVRAALAVWAATSVAVVGATVARGLRARVAHSQGRH